MTGARESTLTEAVNLMLEARRTRVSFADLPTEMQPADMDEVYFVQDKIAAAFGPVGGWKIGAATAEATPMFAPMPAAWMAAGDSVLRGGRYRGLEAEIAFLVGTDMPPRATAYSRAEALGAMASCHPVIEVLESAFTDPTAAARLSSLGDLQMHGGFVYGTPVADWQNIDWNSESVTLTVDGVLRVERTGANTSGDLLKLIPWLANEGAARTGGLKAGQWITTGSWTGNTLAMANSVVEVVFGSAGRVGLSFA